jgi:predicted nucleotidyltransferase
MVTSEQIQNLADQIGREFRPERIILFGSHANGKPTAHSDVDLLVSMHFEGNALNEAARILRKVKPGFAVDLILHRPEQIQQRLEWGDPFVKEAIERGRVLYAAPDG